MDFDLGLGPFGGRLTDSETQKWWTTNVGVSSPDRINSGTAVHRVTKTVQEKAVWTTTQSTYLPQIPTTVDPLKLSQRGLERRLVEQVIAMQPDRRDLGFTEVVVRDVANAVVREIVGIFESLVDRLLIEKKQDTLRTLVAELMTDDLHKTVTAAYEELKEREFGLILSEIKNLRIAGQKAQENWEAKFQSDVKEPLKAYDRLAADMFRRCEETEEEVGRLRVEQQAFPTRVEMDSRLEGVAVDLDAVARTAAAAREGAARAFDQVLTLKSFCAQTYATNTALHDAEQRWGAALLRFEEVSKQGLDELRRHAAAETRVRQLETSHSERLRALDQEVLEVRRAADALEVGLKRLEAASSENFATKEELQQDVGALFEERKQAEELLQSRVGELEVNAATYKALEAVRNMAEVGLLEGRCQQEATTKLLRETHQKLHLLEQEVHTTVATKAFAHEAATSIALHTIAECDYKGLIAQLRHEFEDEKEHSRVTGRQVQQGRKDLSDVIEVFQTLTENTGELQRKFDKLRKDFFELTHVNESRWEDLRISQAAQRTHQEELGAILADLREQARTSAQGSPKAGQFGDSKVWTPSSTAGYLEQIEKASAVLRRQSRVEGVPKDNTGPVGLRGDTRSLPPWTPTPTTGAPMSAEPLGLLSPTPPATWSVRPHSARRPLSGSGTGRPASAPSAENYRFLPSLDPGQG